MTPKTTPAYIFPLVLGAFTGVTYVGFVAVYTVQPMPFIDEGFHIPQAQKYCAGDFYNWDPNITTLPGLYLFSIGILGPISWLIGKSFCDVFCLRLTNLIGAAFLLSTIHKLLFYLHGERVNAWKLILTAVNLSFFPVLHWFSYLYYTDVLSTLLVLAMMLLHLHGAPSFAAAMGVIAVFMRQTNIVWVAFLAGLLAIDALGYHAMRAPVQSFADTKKMFRRLRKMTSKPVMLAELLANVIFDSFGYMFVLGSFCAFVWWNGGIVVGDRESHIPTLHLMQLGYFCVFFTFFSFPFAVGQVRPFVALCRKHPMAFVASFVICACLVHVNTLEHPFLLADNRHYVFYVWRYVFLSIPFGRFFVIPLYLYGAYLLYAFIHTRSFTFRVAFLTCVALTIVPQRLIEPRYFILPFILARLQSVSTSWTLLCCETAFVIGINALTMVIFINKTFMWSDFEHPQRIMW